MKTKDIRQTVTLNAPPSAIYSALLDSKKHSQFTGEPANVSSKPGAAFTCYDGYINGYNLHLVPSKIIVQVWRSGDWPKEHWSIVTFQLASAAGGKTKLTFTHAGVPSGDYQRKNKGWQTHYWQRLKDWLER